VQHLLSLVNRLRQGGISTEIYPDTVKMKKQMSYADAKKIPFVALAGENEIAEQVVQLKDMTTGEQRKVALEEMVSFAKQIFSKNICLFLKYIISLLRKATNHN
jgi:histidyl-tRNA synthetase